MPFGRLKYMKKSTKKKIGRAIGRAFVVGTAIASLSGSADKKVLQEIHAKNSKSTHNVERIIEKKIDWENVANKFIPLKVIDFHCNYLGKRINLGPLVERLARKYDLNPFIAEQIPNLCIKESSLNPFSLAAKKIGEKIVKTGIGIAGIHEDTWQLAKENIDTVLTDAFNPVQNIEASVWYLSYLEKTMTIDGSRQKFESLSLNDRIHVVFYAYLFGPNNISSAKMKSTIPYTEFIADTDPKTSYNAFKKNQINLVYSSIENSPRKPLNLR